MSDEAVVEETAETPAAAEDSTPDLSEQVSNLDQRFNQILERLPEPAPAPAPLDVLSGLDQDEEEAEWVDDDEPAYETPTDPRDQQIEELRNWAVAQESQKQTEALRALADKYPDFEEMVPQIRDALDDAGITDPYLRGNAKVAERFYKSLKAEADASAETPAEEAASSGAAIETGASASALAETDPDASFYENFGSSKDKSVFG
jgi:hypothetical protein